MRRCIILVLIFAYLAVGYGCNQANAQEPPASFEGLSSNDPSARIKTLKQFTIAGNIQSLPKNQLVAHIISLAAEDKDEAVRNQAVLTLNDLIYFKDDENKTLLDNAFPYLCGSSDQRWRAVAKSLTCREHFRTVRIGPQRDDKGRLLSEFEKALVAETYKINMLDDVARHYLYKAIGFDQKSRSATAGLARLGAPIVLPLTRILNEEFQRSDRNRTLVEIGYEADLSSRNAPWRIYEEKRPKLRPRRIDYAAVKVLGLVGPDAKPAFHTLERWLVRLESPGVFGDQGLRDRKPKKPDDGLADFSLSIDRISPDLLKFFAKATSDTLKSIDPKWQPVGQNVKEVETPSRSKKRHPPTDEENQQ